MCGAPVFVISESGIELGRWQRCTQPAAVDVLRAQTTTMVYIIGRPCASGVLSPGDMQFVYIGLACDMSHSVALVQ